MPTPRKSKPKATAAKANADSGYTTAAEAAKAVSKSVDAGDKADTLRTEDEQQVVQPPPVDTDDGKMAEMQRLMKSEGYSFAEAAAVVADIEREADEAAAKPKPDPRVTYEVHLAPRHAEWLERMAGFEGQIRREKNLTPSRMLEIIVREAYAADPTKAGTVGGETTGPRGEFNPVTGRWDT